MRDGERRNAKRDGTRPPPPGCCRWPAAATWSIRRACASFELWDVIPEEVAGYFRDLRPYVSLCRFPDCTHTHEDDCAVKDAVADGRLDERRYESYCHIVRRGGSIGAEHRAGTESHRERRQRGGRSWSGVLLPGRPPRAEPPLEELEGWPTPPAPRVVGQLTQRREAPDATTYLGKGKVDELKRLVGRRRRRRGDLRQRSQPRPNPQPGKGHRREGPRPHRVDPRHLRQPGPDARGPAGRRIGAIGIRHAAAEADVDAPLAAEARAWGSAGRAKSSWKSTAAWSRTGSTTCAGSCSAIERRREREVAARRDADDRLAGRLHQRRQEHAVERR